MKIQLTPLSVQYNIKILLILKYIAFLKNLLRINLNELINDFSTDNSSQIIKNLQERDSRIKIVHNKKNMGSLYSRSIGALFANGEYIFPLDNDDMFFSEDIFDSILNIATESDLDIVGFRGIQMSNYNAGIKGMRDLYNYQPNFNLIKNSFIFTTG